MSWNLGNQMSYTLVLKRPLSFAQTSFHFAQMSIAKVDYSHYGKITKSKGSGYSTGSPVE